MSIKQLKKLFLNATDSLSISEIVRSLNIIQDNVSQSLDPLTKKVQNDPTNLNDITLLEGQVNIINHTLGRKLLGYDVMLKKGPGRPPIISNDQDHNPSPQLTLWLWTTDDCQVNLMVY